MKENNHEKPLKIHIIHTSFVSVNDLTNLFKEMAPEIIIHHTIDDTLLREVLDKGGVTAAVRSRLIEYYKAAEIAGADLIFNQCSSVGEVADIAKQIVTVPVVKVDEEMARIACETGLNIGVVATLETTLAPTCRLIENTAKKLSKNVTITRCLVDGAFNYLINGEREKHNQMVIDAIKKLTESVDVVVCAQGSMMAIIPNLGETKVPVLTSPRTGVESAIRFIRTYKKKVDGERI
jgi:aspartate/glutamate racemase